tara:strand:+ start:828 stop:1421 length:594 start_codon:yes stop_codon:yes gene_type:complete
MENMKLNSALNDFRKAAIVGKSGKNPMFKSQYSTLGDVLTALNGIADFGLSFQQFFSDDCIVTVVAHVETGEQFTSAIPVRPEKNTPQSYISCVTYLRRASLMTMFGLNADDDDGNLASGSGAFPSRSQPRPKAPAVASTPAVGAATSSVLAEKLDACKSVRDVNALYTKLFGASGIKAPDDQIAMFSKRKDELQND